MRFTAAVFLALFLLPSLVFADQFQDGQAALSRRDYQTALKLLQPLAEQGNAPAQVRIGVMYEQGKGVPQDHAEAVKWWRKAADQGVVDGQALLGHMYESGSGVKQDYAEAAKETVRDRTIVQRHLTSQQVSDIQRRAVDWKPTPEQPRALAAAQP